MLVSLLLCRIRSDHTNTFAEWRYNSRLGHSDRYLMRPPSNWGVGRLTPYMQPLPCALVSFARSLPLESPLLTPSYTEALTRSGQGRLYRNVIPLEGDTPLRHHVSQPR